MCTLKTRVALCRRSRAEPCPPSCEVMQAQQQDPQPEPLAYATAGCASESEPVPLSQTFPASARHAARPRLPSAEPCRCGCPAAFGQTPERSRLTGDHAATPRTTREIRNIARTNSPRSRVAGRSARLGRRSPAGPLAHRSVIMAHVDSDPASHLRSLCPPMGRDNV